MKKSMFDDEGVDFLNMRLVVVLIASALLIAIAAVCVNGYTDSLSRGRAVQEACRIASLANAEYATGCPGTGSKASIAVNIPGCVRRMVFGRSPTEVDANRSDRAYFIEFTGGTVVTRLSNCPFASDNSGKVEDAGVALYPGEYSLELETVEINGTYAVAIYGGSEC